MIKLRLLFLLSSLFIGACQCEPSPEVDAGLDAGIAADVTADDVDATGDANVVDATPIADVEVADAGRADVERQSDAGLADALLPDVISEDVVVADAGPIARCGDATLDDNEVCDDGVNDGAYEGCAPGCQALGPRCGDAVVSDGELCDDAVNDGAYEGCAPGCQALGPRCGDAVVSDGELCDDAVNDGAYEGCAPGCQALGPRCGDAVVSDGELCDDAVNNGINCEPGCLALPPRVIFNEIMYHPVKEEDFTDRHEFIELVNPSDRPVDLSDWLLRDGVEFRFAPGTEIAAGGFIVIAKDPAAFALEYPNVDAAKVTGPYEKSLGNGGDTLVLTRANGSNADEVEYDDDFPWPTAADALGANGDWLPPEKLPVIAHQYRGHSLERVSVDSPSSDAANWVVSVLDAPTPGAPNTAERALPLAQVTRHLVMREGSENAPLTLLLAGDVARVEVSFSQAVSEAQLELFDDDLNVENEVSSLVSLRDDGVLPDAVAGDLRYTALLGTRAERTLVRYRVRADRGQGDVVIAPRSGEPFKWFSFFISPDHSAQQTRSYEFLIADNAWGEMWTNIDPGRVDECAVRPEWNAKVPAVFVHEGHVYDVRVRHHGSIFQRKNGIEIEWPFAGPSEPDPLLSLSWRVAFPRYDRLNKRNVILLNKLNQACSGLSSHLGYAMARQMDLVAPKNVRYARMFVNGGYYNTMLEVDRMGEVMAEQYEEDYAEKYGLEEAPLGNLIKATGSGRQGPFVRSEGNPITEEFCGYSPQERYVASYERKTNDWLPHDDFISLIEEGDAAAAAGPSALRAFASARYDVERMLNFLVARQYPSSWDDDNHNWFIYQNRNDGRYFMQPWDLDLTFGSTSFDNGSRYYAPLDVGDPKYIGDPTVRGNVNYLKYYFMSAYYDEYITHLKEVNQSTFAPAELNAIIDAFTPTLDVTDAESSQSGLFCDVGERTASIKKFIQDRHDFIEAWPPIESNPMLTAVATASSEATDAVASPVANSHDNILHIRNYFESADADLNPSVLYDLGAPTAIARVHVTTGIECCDVEQDYNLLVEVLDENQNLLEAHPVVNPWDGIGTPSSRGLVPTYVDFELSAALNVQFIRVSKQGFAGSERLRLSEVRAHP